MHSPHRAGGALMPDILAAGGVVWREVDGTRCVGLVHRNRYGGDVALPKGKLERGETLKQCAQREVGEELGCDTQLGSFLGAMCYPVAGGDKYVLYWAMDWVGDLDGGPDGREITGRLWLPAAQALTALSYASERELLARALTGHQLP